MESAGIINEIWRSVSGFPNYQISNIGRIRRTETGIILTPHKNVEYLVINLYNDGNLKKMYVHRLVATEFIENPFNKPQVDHINGDKSNNCVNNLRWVFDNENSRNRKKMQKHTTSIYKGVSWHKQSSKWRATIKKNDKCFHIGSFEHEKDAARAYNTKAVELFGDYANLNVISDDEESDGVEDNDTQ